MDPHETHVGVREGDVVAGKYRVERVLAVGGMGFVVAAHHLDLDERVAIKFLLPAALANAEAVARFYREARAAVKIKSEHVARVIDVGRLDTGAPYIVMEYLAGKDLLGWLEEHGPLPFEQAVDFVLQASEAIAEAHALGIVHRDLKPSNLFCIQHPDGRLSIKVLDFGISKIALTGGTDDSITRTSAIVGSPMYMSPEQMESSKDVDARTDIWSLGIILYMLLTGRPPFDAETLIELVVRTATEQAPRVSSLRPDVPRGLEKVIERCLEKSRDNRFQNVGELARALAQFGGAGARTSVERILGTLQASGMEVTPATEPLSAVPTVRAGATVAPWQADTEAKRGGRSFVGAAVAVAVWALALGIGTLAWTRRHAPAAPPSTTETTNAAQDGERVLPQEVVTPPEPTVAAPVVTVTLEDTVSSPPALSKPAGNSRSPRASGAPRRNVTGSTGAGESTGQGAATFHRVGTCTVPRMGKVISYYSPEDSTESAHAKCSQLGTSVSTSFSTN